jgi:glycosyltransferase involved in cell wall biosynthesis
VMYSIVVPIYNNEGSLELLYSNLNQINRALDGKVKVVFVVDGSPDNSWMRIATDDLPRSFPASAVRLVRNVGALGAVRYGLSLVDSDSVCVMSADCQEPIELIIELLKHASSRDDVVVVGVRTSRKESLISRMLSNAYWRSFRRLSRLPIPDGGVDIFALSKEPRSQIEKFGEPSYSLIGQIFWLGYEVIEVPYERLERVNGRSSWSLSKRIVYAAQSIISFSALPLVFVAGIGTVLACIAVVTATSLVVIRSAFLSFSLIDFVVPLTFFALLSFVLSGIGIVGLYLWQVVEIMRDRPSPVVCETTEFLRAKKSTPCED